MVPKYAAPLETVSFVAVKCDLLYLTMRIIITLLTLAKALFLT
jgi:hypothetical protein